MFDITYEINNRNDLIKPKNARNINTENRMYERFFSWVFEGTSSKEFMVVKTKLSDVELTNAKEILYDKDWLYII